ncbi:DUF393 domain-containing protein [Pseudomaricurvus alkylphenolicus]|uniref:thiol-disulfide oxidoreductase DCC family protein n=1 Tax=Pseudomaricurvus alkylphenolicus TaxID=1306991 RepID=UPI00141DD8DA|nr:DCC1-like thiol-disulfide oxidoreductase family protein [Pseudomaricurvus alkylphenolicus]NIB39870.1 DUF393 domain-containing protein [Pseudomaricurvus alkylphenolicus]
MRQTHNPPYIKDGDCIILFDGVCKLCNAWANFIIDKDANRTFKLCSVQSAEGKAILDHFNYPTDYYETMLYVEGNRFYEKSTAFFGVVDKLGYPWKMFCVFRVLPISLRDWIYDRIALNRYRIFGRYDYCVLPSADHKGRYIHED